MVSIITNFHKQFLQEGQRERVTSLQRINQILGFKPIDRLNHLHIFDPAQAERISEELSHQMPILDPDLYIKVADQLPDLPEDEFALESQHIHNKLIFDSMNDVLDLFRPYGLNGQPYPWKQEIKHYKIKPITEENYEDVLEMAKEKVLEWASYQCGLLIEKDEALSQNMPQRNIGYDEAYLAQIREEKLHNMLAIEVYENEEKWVNYDEEETEVGVEVADMVFEKLVTEIVKDINSMRKKRDELK